MLPNRKILPHGVPNWVAAGSTYFITINCRTCGKNQLCNLESALRIRESIGFRQMRGEWWVRLFVLMPDHCHGLISFSRDLEMKASIANWKRFTARQFGIEWQRDFFDHRIRDAAAMQEKAQYIRMNPVRKGLCDLPQDWPYLWSALDLEG
jgi:putative transposase